MQIDDKLVDHLAYLSRLKLTDAEKESLKGNLQKILSYVEELKEPDVADVKPLVSSTSDQGNVLRDDAVRPCLPVDKALQNAPDKQGNFFRVPKIIETTNAHE